jgi:hypothetical protein
LKRRDLTVEVCADAFGAVYGYLDGWGELGSSRVGVLKCCPHIHSFRL